MSKHVSGVRISLLAGRLVGRAVALAGLLLASACAAPAPASPPTSAPAQPPASTPPASTPVAAAKPTVPAAATSAPATGSQPSAQSPAIQALYAAAKQEGTATLWMQATPEQFQVLVDGFKATFPGIDLKYFQILPEEAAPKLAAEAQANGGKVSADTLQSNLPTAQVLAQRGLLLKPDWSSLGLPADRIIGENWGAGYFTAMNPMIYNTNLLSAADVPKSWDELGDPKWKGKIILESRGLSISGLFPVLGDQDVLDLTRKIMANDPLVISSQTTVLQDCAAGQAPLAVAPLQYQASEAMHKGAPIALVPNLPATGRTIGNVALTGPHPNAAKLFAWWIGTDEGQTYTLKSQGAALLTSTSDTQVDRDLKAANVQVKVLTADQEVHQGELGRQMQPIITHTG